MEPTQIDLNSAQCTKEATYFGYTHYVNICSGKTTDVQWGNGDWAGILLLSAIGVVVLGFVATALVVFVKDMVFGY